MPQTTDPKGADMLTPTEAAAERETAREAEVNRLHAEYMNELGLTEEDNADESEELWAAIYDDIRREA